MAPQSRRRQPRQQRSRQMVEFILEAATKVFAEHGFETATTNQIAQRAGISIGSLYQYFPNKAALIAEIKKQHQEEILASVQDAIYRSKELPIAEAIRNIIEANFDIHLNAPRLHAAFEEQIPTQFIQSQPGDFQDRITKTIHAFLESRRDEIGTQDLDTAVFVTRNLVRSVLHASVEGGEVVDNPDQVIEQLVSSILGCLGPAA